MTDETRVWRFVAAQAARIEALTKALDNLNKASDAVWREINEFDKPVSSEIYGWWEQAQLDADAALRQSQPDAGGVGEASE